jgi:phenylacetate-CoA ligase
MTPTRTKFYDKLEMRDPAARRRWQRQALIKQIAHAKANAPFYRALLRKVDPKDITDRAALARLPVTRKADLAERQRVKRPLGGLEGVKPSALAHIYQSPGPIYEADGLGPDHWRFARSLWAAGFRSGELIHNSFTYHLAPAGQMVESGARAIGCPVFPGGVGNTEMQVQAIADLRPAGYCGTPSFLRILLDKAADLGRDTRSLKKAVVGGEALPPSLRQYLSERGVAVLQNYGTADLGLIAYESPARDGMIIDEGVLVEIVRPGTGDPVPDGQVGEVVVTTLANPTYPLIRFATGDLSAIMAGASPCGRTNQRIKGWLGRADQTTKVKGMFVTPGQIAQIAARHPEIRKARLEVVSQDKLDEMTLRCEVAADLRANTAAALAGRIAETLAAIAKVRGHVEIVAANTLPNDGKVIVDLRTYA